MGSNEKPITNLTISIKVQYLLSITPFYNGVLGAHNWDIILSSIWKESNLLDTPPWSNRSALICLPNRLSKFTLNSMWPSHFFIMGLESIHHNWWNPLLWVQQREHVVYLPILRYSKNSFSSVLIDHKGITIHEFSLSFFFLNFPYLVFFFFFFLVEEPKEPWLPYEHLFTL